MLESDGADGGQLNVASKGGACTAGGARDGVVRSAKTSRVERGVDSGKCGDSALAVGLEARACCGQEQELSAGGSKLREEHGPAER